MQLSDELLSEEEKTRLQELTLHSQLAEEGYTKLLREKDHEVNYDQLFSWLVDDERQLTVIQALLRKKVGTEYGRQTR